MILETTLIAGNLVLIAVGLRKSQKASQEEAVRKAVKAAKDSKRDDKPVYDDSNDTSMAT